MISPALTDPTGTLIFRFCSLSFTPTSSYRQIESPLVTYDRTHNG